MTTTDVAMTIVVALLGGGAAGALAWILLHPFYGDTKKERALYADYREWVAKEHANGRANPNKLRHQRTQSDDCDAENRRAIDVRVTLPIQLTKNTRDTP